MLDYLDTTDLSKIKLLYFLENSKTSAIAFDKVQEEISFTKYQTTRLIEGIKADLQMFNYPNCFHFDLKTKKQHIIYKRLTHENIYMLIARYAKRSRLGKMVEFIVSEKGEKILDLEEYLYISHSGMYRLLELFKELSSDYRIEVSKKIRFSGNEWEIREFLYQFYYVLYKSFAYPFSETIEQRCQTIIFLLVESGLFERKLSDAEYIKVTYRLFVLLVRNHMGYFAQQPPFKLEEKNYFSEKIYKIFECYFDGDEEELKKEVAQFLFFLETEDILPIRTKTEEVIVVELNRLFIQYIEKHGKNLLPFTKQKRFLQELVRIHRRCFLLKRPNFYMAKYQNFDFIRENYSFAEIISNGFVQSLLEEKKFLALTKKMYKELVCEYLFLLMNQMPESELSFKVSVYVDFSYGKNYNEYIIKNLTSFQQMNLNILTKENVERKIVDIYLSDIPTVKKYPFQILWTSPPSPYDWESFGELVVKARREKSGK